VFEIQRLAMSLFGRFSSGGELAQLICAML
jgi:hypothetical protein